LLVVIVHIDRRSADDYRYHDGEMLESQAFSKPTRYYALSASGKPWWIT